MRKTLFIIILIILSLTSCALFDWLFASNEAAILSFTMPGMVGDAVIDITAGTVTAVVQPEDIRTIIPTITVSEGALLTSAPALMDGEAVFFTVTAASGTTRPWSVAVTVQYGMTFSLNTPTDTISVRLLEGYIDTADAVHNEKIGNGVPFSIMFADSDYRIMASSEKIDLSVQGSQAYRATVIYLDNYTSGIYDTNHSVIAYSDTINQKSYYFMNGFADTTVELLNSALPGETLCGTFRTSITNPDTNETWSITDGFLKVIRLDDDAALH